MWLIGRSETSARWPRGVIDSWADGRVEDTGPLTKKRMETIDDELIPEAQRFIKDAVGADTPFFVWFNTTGTHFRIHVADEKLGRAGVWQSEYHDGMVEHDRRIGEMLDQLDELGIADDTIVVHRQRRAHEQLARRWRDTVPEREELDVGGGLPRAGHGSLARSHRDGSGAERHRQPCPLVRHVACRGR